MTEPTTANLFDYLTWFRGEVFEEVRRAVALYGEELGGELARYYGSAMREFDRDPVHRLRRYARTRERFMAERLAVRASARVLDCGCGSGSEDLLFALLGAEVVGIDLKQQRLHLAAARRDRWSREVGRELRIDFRHENLFDLSFDGEFDYVWVKEAISHIHPLPEFYAWAHRALRPGGELVVTDPNAERPRTRAQVEALREGPLIKTFPHPHTGEPIPYADERILTIPELTAGMREAGFRIGEAVGFVPGQSSTPLWLWRFLVQPLNHCLPLARRFGNEFCVAGIKP
ncbi:MAG: class I SAM-dependent methyltransferase [Candidatus Krumholzibacteriota bacterium]|nr:class I SAM-dependent methyltransferase [Candidatus Krumholzibacteriota bacterium]